MDHEEIKVDKFFPVNTEKDSMKMLRLINSEIYRDKKIDGLQCNIRLDFPGSHPVTLLRKHIQTLVDKDYLVCEKSDGTRLLWVVMVKKEGTFSFFLDRKNVLYTTGFNFNVDKEKLQARTEEKEKIEKDRIEQKRIENEMLNKNIERFEKNELEKLKLGKSDMEKKEIENKFFQEKREKEEKNNLEQKRLLDDLIQEKKARENFNLFLFDGEIYIENSPKGKHLIFALFDTILYESKSVMALNLIERMNLARTFLSIYRPFHKYVLVMVKDMYKSYRFCDVYKNLDKLHHKNDGMIFTPLKDPYIPGRCNNLFKWKPSDLNTADFLIKKIDDMNFVYFLMCNGRNNKMFQYAIFVDYEGIDIEDEKEKNRIKEMEVKENNEIEKLNEKKMCTINAKTKFEEQEMVDYKDTNSSIINKIMHEDLENNRNLDINNNEKRKEVFDYKNHDISKEKSINDLKNQYHMNSESESKKRKYCFTNNDKNNNEPEKKKILEEIETETSSRYDGKIGEFSYCEKRKTIDIIDFSEITGAWKLHRIRSDKTTSNSLNVVLNVLSSIKEKIVYEELSRYHEKIYKNWKKRETTTIKK